MSQGNARSSPSERRPSQTAQPQLAATQPQAAVRSCHAPPAHPTLARALLWSAAMASRTISRCAVGLAAVASLLALGCASPVHTDFDAEVDFSDYATYDWLLPPVKTLPAPSATEGFDPFAGNSLVDKRVRRAVDQQLGSRGYQQNDGGAPDFLLQYHVIMNDKASDHRRYGGSSDHRAHRYQQGTLFLDVIDARTERIAWRGWTAGWNLEGYFTQAQLAKSVREVLLHFPPQGVTPPEEKTPLHSRVQELER